MSLIRYIVLFSMISLTLLVVSYVHAYTQDECIACHTMDSNESMLHISIQEFQNSIHGDELSCLDCHASIMGKDHEKGTEAIPVDCNKCHEQENIHGSGTEARDRPKCYNCHGKHNILKKDEYRSSVHWIQLKYTCSECHPVECGEGEYLSWMPSLQIKSHKKQDFSMDYDRFNCVGCHQGQAAHGEKQMQDGQDCHLCHMKLKDYEPIMNYIHPRADHENKPAIFFAAIVSNVFLLLILLGVARYAWTMITGRPKDQKG